MQSYKKRVAVGTNKANDAKVFTVFYALLVFVRNHYFHRCEVILKIPPLGDTKVSSMF